MENQQTKPEAYLPEEVCSRSRVKKPWFYANAEKNRLPFPVLKRGRLLRIPAEPFDRFMAGANGKE